MITVTSTLLDQDTHLTTVSGPKSAYPAYVQQLRAMEAAGEALSWVAVRITVTATDFVTRMILRTS